LAVIEILKTDTFDKWFRGLRDARARARIDERIERLANGNSGDVKPVGEGVSEMRIDYGPGYRLYFVRRGAALIILLCGGDKASQQRDIGKAIRLAKGMKP
jgi:putative addiction module killer protein